MKFIRYWKIVLGVLKMKLADATPEQNNFKDSSNTSAKETTNVKK